MMQKSSLSNFCLTNVRNLKVFLEVHGRDIDFAKSEQRYHLTSTNVRNLKVFLEVHGRDIVFAKSEQRYHLTSTDAEAAAVYAFVVRKRPKTGFLVRGPNVIHQNLLTKFVHSMKMYNLRLNIHRFKSL